MKPIFFILLLRKGTIRYTYGNFSKFDSMKEQNKNYIIK